MTDIVERLRTEAFVSRIEAADEIERLRAERDVALVSASQWPEACGDATVDLMVERDLAIAERDRLREALKLAADALSDASLLDAWADARTALKETGHG